MWTISNQINENKNQNELKNQWFRCSIRTLNTLCILVLFFCCDSVERRWWWWCKDRTKRSMQIIIAIFYLCHSQTFDKHHISIKRAWLFIQLFLPLWTIDFAFLSTFVALSFSRWIFFSFWIWIHFVPTARG